MRRFSASVRIVVIVAGVVFVVLIPLSFLGYTSVGFDFEYERDRRVVEEVFRMRWPGDGSFCLVHAMIHYNLDEEDVDRIDPAARFLSPRRDQPTIRSACRFAIVDGPPEGRKGTLISSRWLIVPSWLPAVLLLIVPATRRIRQRIRGTAGRERPGTNS